MRVKVVKEFHDKDNFAVVYKVGDEIGFTEERAASLLALGLVEKIEAETEKKERKRKKPQE